MTFARLARALFPPPSAACPNCGEQTRHGHFVQPWRYEPGYWACHDLFLRRPQA